MSTERTLEVPSGAAVGPVKAAELSPEDVKKLRAERKAKFTRILERGVLIDRMAIELPPHLHGEWCSNEPTEIARLEALGFQIDTEYAPKSRLHDTGNSRAIVGDVIHMVCDKDTMGILDEIRREKFVELHGTSKEKGQLEEKQFAAAVPQGVPVIQESKSQAASGTDIVRTLKQ